MSYVAYFDGSVRKNISSFSYVIFDQNNQEIARVAQSIREAEPFVAEWRALRNLLRKIRDLKLRNVVVYGDCKNLIDLANGKKTVYTEEYNSKEVNDRISSIHALLKQISSCQLVWKKREFNVYADQLCKTIKVETDLAVTFARDFSSLDFRSAYSGDCCSLYKVCAECQKCLWYTNFKSKGRGGSKRNTCCKGCMRERKQNALAFAI